MFAIPEVCIGCLSTQNLASSTSIPEMPFRICKDCANERKRIGDKIEIRPGIKRSNKYHPLTTNITSIYQGDIPLDSAHPGGLIAIGTTLDPSLTKADTLIGNLAGHVSKLPEVQNQCDIEVHLLTKVLGADEDIQVSPLKIGEAML